MPQLGSSYSNIIHSCSVMAWLTERVIVNVLEQRQYTVDPGQEVIEYHAFR